MAEILGFETGLSLPSFTSGNTGFWITVVAIIALVLVSAGILLWIFWFIPRTFSKKIEIYENIAGQGYQRTRIDCAKTVKVGNGGEEILYLRKSKCYRTAYGRKIGFNTYAFAVGQDGYWYNFLHGDLDAKMGMLDIEPVDRDLRYMHVAIRKNITERYRKVGVMEKYGTLIIGGISIIIVMVALWLLVSKIGGLITVATQTVEASKPIADALTNAVSKLDNICSASGLRPA